MLHAFSLDTIKDLDPALAERFSLLLRQAIADLEDRPNAKAARIVTLETMLVPTAGQDGRLTGASVDFKVKLKTPIYEVTDYSMGIRVDPKTRQLSLVFSDEDPHNVCQLGFGDIVDEEGHAEQRFQVKKE